MKRKYFIFVVISRYQFSAFWRMVREKNYLEMFWPWNFLYKTGWKSKNGIFITNLNQEMSLIIPADVLQAKHPERGGSLPSGSPWSKTITPPDQQQWEEILPEVPFVGKQAGLSPELSHREDLQGCGVWGPENWKLAPQSLILPQMNSVTPANDLTSSHLSSSSAKSGN